MEREPTHGTDRSTATAAQSGIYDNPQRLSHGNPQRLGYGNP